MLQITKVDNFLKVVGDDNIFFPNNAELSFPLNSVACLIDESNMATFKSAATGDVLFSGIISNITIAGEAVTKDTILEAFDAVANSESGEGEDSVARQALTEQVGLDSDFEYESPVEEGNTMAEDIAYLSEHGVYTAGDGIDITNNEIAVDNTIARTSDIPDVSDFITESAADTRYELQENLASDVQDILEGSGYITETAADAKYAQIGDSYTKDEADETFATQDALGQLAQSLEDASTAIQTSVGLDSNLGYDSPIETGNSVKDDITYLTEHGGTTYTAGDGIDITNNEIAVDNTIARTSDIPDVSDFVTQEDLEDTEEVFSRAINQIKESAGLDSGLNYTSPIEEGNTMTDDITVLAESGGVAVKPYSALRKVGRFLHEITYDETDYEGAREYFNALDSGDASACSAIREGNIFARNFDWEENNDYETGRADFIVRMPANDTFHSVMGMASLDGITEQMACEHSADELFGWLPFAMKDGRNDAGVFAAINVVPSDKGNNQDIYPELDEVETLNSSMIVSAVLLKCGSAMDAIEYLRDHVHIHIAQNLIDMDYDVHYMIGDAEHTYVVEFVNGLLVYQEHGIMTNFHINGVTFLSDGKVYTNADAALGNLPSTLGITDYGAGLERYNYLVENGVEGIANCLYSKTYDLPIQWFSEYVNRDYSVTVDTLPDNENMQLVINYAQQIKEGEVEGTLWCTHHSAVYDLEANAMKVVGFEETGNPVYIGSFCQGGGGTEYEAGDGIDITGNVISVDDSVAKTSDIPDVSDFITETAADAKYEEQGNLASDVQDILEGSGYATQADFEAAMHTVADAYDALITSIAGKADLTALNALINRVVSLENAVASMPTFTYDEETNTLDINQ